MVTPVCVSEIATRSRDLQLASLGPGLREHPQLQQRTPEVFLPILGTFGNDNFRESCLAFSSGMVGRTYCHPSSHLGGQACQLKRRNRFENLIKSSNNGRRQRIDNLLSWSHMNHMGHYRVPFPSLLLLLLLLDLTHPDMFFSLTMGEGTFSVGSLPL